MAFYAGRVEGGGGREASPCLLWGALVRTRVGQAWGQTL